MGLQEFRKAVGRAFLIHLLGVAGAAVAQPVPIAAPDAMPPARAGFERMIDRLNLGVLQFDVVGAPVTPVGSGLRQPRLADMPLFMDTGDPVLDQQRYAAYKSAWIAAHPDQYRELTAPQGATTNPDPE